jgi:hypothetical protein
LLLKVVRVSAILVAAIRAFIVGVAGWFLHDLVRYDACLDRINYDKALWHLCDAKEPRKP